MPRVSVILTTYNRADLLPRAVQSVLDQTYQDLELILIDDASTDNTQEVINKISDERVRAVRLDTNRGICNARNVGINNASGEYICFLDDDDEYTAFRLEKQVEFLDRSDPGTALVYGDTLEQNDSGGNIPDEKGRVIVSNDVYELALQCENITGSISFLARTSVVREIGGFHERSQYFEDRMFICKILQRYQIAYLPMTAAIVHIGHGYPRTADTRKSLNEEMESRERYFEFHVEEFRESLEANPKSYSRLLYKYSKDHMRFGSVMKAISLAGSGFRRSPLDIVNIKQLLRLLILFIMYRTFFSRYLPLARRIKSYLR